MQPFSNDWPRQRALRGFCFRGRPSRHILRLSVAEFDPRGHGEGLPGYLSSFATPPSSSPLPPAAAFVRLLHLLQFALKPRHQIFGNLQSASFIEDLGLGLDNSLLRRLALPANVICLLLQATTIYNLTLQGGLDGGRPASQLRRLGLGSSELVAQCVVSIARRIQLPRQRLNNTLQRGYSGCYRFGGGLGISIKWLASLPHLPRASGEHFGWDADFRFESVISDSPRPLRTPGPRCGSAGTTQA
jgi:hypothetical protein